MCVGMCVLIVNTVVACTGVGAGLEDTCAAGVECRCWASHVFRQIDIKIHRQSNVACLLPWRCGV